eukprot:254332-Pleurochrysis_carterae.AAC.4
MVRLLRFAPTTQRGLRSPHSQHAGNGQLQHACPRRGLARYSHAKDDACDAHSTRQWCTPLPAMVLVPVPHTPSRCLRDRTDRPHGASEHALLWPQGASRRRTRPAAATCSTRRPYAHAYASVVASHRLTVEVHRRRHAR